MSGPTKLKSTKKMSMAKPMTASRLLANSRRASRHPLWTAPTSPPSGARCTSSGGRDRSIAMVASFLWPGRSGQADARVGDGERDVRDQVADDDEDGARQGVGEHDRVVDLLQAGEEQQPQALEVEKRLGDQVAGQQGGQGQPDQRDHRQAGVADQVPGQ